MRLYSNAVPAGRSRRCHSATAADPLQSQTARSVRREVPGLPLYSKPGFAAGLPKEETCMGCHITIKTDSPAIQKLASFHKTKKPTPWVKVYTVPDYVFFSHEVHHKEAHLECETCHGPVAQRDVIVKEKPTSMTACVDCHEKSGAPRECDVCHDKR